VTDTISTLHDELAALDRAYSPGHHGLWSARKRTALVDAALIELFETDAPAGTAIAALGGYGRGRQLPFSDIDLLILHHGSDPEGLARLTDRMLYPLWDAGFEVGQAVRTPSECLTAAGERLDALTAMLDARYLAGDAGLFEAAMAPVVRQASDDIAVFAARLAGAAEERTERYGSTAHGLEPDLKEGSGGLRDIASFGWLERSTGALLESSGVLRPSERELIDEAEEFLIRARSAVQLAVGKRRDRLTSDLQPGVASDMGFTDEPRLPAPDGLMRAVFERARDVEHIRDEVFTRVALRAITDAPPGAGVPAADPLDAEGVLAALDVNDQGQLADPQLLDRIEAADIPDPVVWTSGVRERFLTLLRAGRQGAAALDTLDRVGSLERFLPAWSDVRCRPQRDPYHRFTVDSHLTYALAGMAQMLRGEDLDGEDPFEADLVGLIDDQDALLLGALFHDIGKNGGGNHVPAGAEISMDLLQRMGVPTPTRDLAAFMAAEHLLLPDTATRRDLSDENLILGVAARIATPSRLAALYLLAKADALATGPAAWTPWRRTLVRELAVRVLRVFERGQMGTELAERLADRLARVRELLASEPDVAVERFMVRMPRGYFLSVEPAQAARHFSVIAPDIGVHEVRTVSRPGTREDTYELLVVAADHPGLLSEIAGSLALAGLSVLSAQVFTTDDHVAADLFEVQASFGTTVEEDRWRSFRKALRRAVEGRTSLAHQVAEKRAHYPAPSRPTPVTVRVDNDASDFYTVVEVGAPDRIGLLFDITQTLADLDLDVHVAKVATYPGRVIDAFYVRHVDGTKVTDPGEVARIEAAFHVAPSAP
jgi:[protein-PII] uridylyltransferase